MSYVIDLDARHHILRVTVTTATLTDEEFKDIYRCVANIASEGGPYAMIVDLSQVTHMPVSARTVRTLAESAPAIPGRTRRVAVARAPIAYGLCRMFELTREMSEQLEIVRSLEEAYESLRVTADDFSQRLFPERSAA